MFESLYKAVTDWPVVVQGALGSALFAIVMVAGQKITSVGSKWMRSRSQQSRLTALYETLLRLEAVTSTESVEHAKYAAVLVYRAMRYLTRALIWLALGLVLGSMFPVLGIVGFMGCLFYLFRTLNVVAPTDASADVESKKEELRAEIKKLSDEVGTG